MTADDLPRLMGLLGAAGTILAPLVDRALAERPATTDAGLEQIVALMLEVSRRLGLERTSDLLRLTRELKTANESTDADFMELIEALPTEDATPILGALTLCNRFAGLKKDPTTGPLVQAALARHRA